MDGLPATWAEAEAAAVAEPTSGPFAGAPADVIESLSLNPNAEHNVTRDLEAQEVRRDDLLGLGKINVQSGAFIGRPGGPVRPPTSAASARINPSSSSFDPEAYLTHYHSATSLEELTRGRSILEAVIQRQSKELPVILRENLHRLVPCVAASQDVRRTSLDPASTSGVASAKAAEAGFVETKALTQQVYGPMLQRRLKTERLQRVMAVVKKHDYLFDLPSKLLSGFDLGETEEVVENLRKAKLWLSVQNDERLQKKISSGIDSALEKFRSRQYKRLEDPVTGHEDIERIVGTLEALQPEEDHALNLLISRRDFGLEKLKQIRGHGASNVRLTTPAVDVAVDNAEDVEHAVANANVVVHQLVDALQEALSHYWRLASIFVKRTPDGAQHKTVVQTLGELITAFAEEMRMTLLPPSSGGAALISHESAQGVRRSFDFALELEIPDDYLGPLVNICSEVAETYVSGVVRNVRNVAVELGSEFPEDHHSLAEQVRLLVSEALAELEAVVLPETQAAHLVKNACVRAPVAAARALKAVALSRQHRSTNREMASKYLKMAGCCYQLRTAVLPYVQRVVGGSLGQDGLDYLIRNADTALSRVERQVAELFAHEAAIPLVLRILRALTVGGEILRLLPRPRVYAVELVLELAMRFATVRSAGLSVPPEDVCAPLVRAVGSAYGQAIQDCDTLSENAAEQCLFEMSFVEHVLRELQNQVSDGRRPQGATDDVTRAFFAAKQLLEPLRSKTGFEQELSTAIRSVTFLRA